MDLSVILKNLQISMEDSCDSSHSCPLAMVLKHIQDMLKPNASEQGVFILGTTEQLFLNADVSWLFPAIPETELRSIYIDFVKSLMYYAALPVCDTDSGNLPPSFFRDIPGRSCAVSAVMQALLLRLGDTEAPLYHITRNRSLTRALAPFMCVFSVTHLQDQPWTSEASKKDALGLLASISQTIGHECCLDLLCGKTVDDHTGVLQTVLDMLKSELTKENWKQNQATKHVFSWILVQVKRPWLVYYLESVFPPSLLISDDHLLENKVLGVHCLHHIILNVPAADLRQFNRAHVIYHALFNHLYTSEAQLLEVVLPCLLDLLSVLERPHADISCPRKRNRYDQVLCHILTYMEMEDKIALRLLYATTLIPFIERMGIVIVRHLKRLERVIIGYLEISDSPEEKTRLTILAVLEKTIQVAWPRIECRMPVLGRSLLRLLCDVTRETQPPDVRKDLLVRTTHCLQMLDSCSHGKLKGILEEVDNTCANETVLECIKMITDPPSYELITQQSPAKE
ncbi:hypothetical protein AALO_G00060240 [Alosa alosa]|uniref:TELO2-interacting protein 2 n=1 Tax=Alosa alosa TaxID=278164 RepID=A0AAV6GZB5_9TELE|nr:TELO2-interacting protein 2 isoform X1 [Alosa alosa]KAG5280458.1 hypothetical protein AALO_G00060240 [Alosa alosa]